MRILHLSWSLQQGGLEKLVVDLARQQLGAGHQPLVAVFSPGGPLVHDLEAAGIPLFVLPKRHGLDPGLSGRLRRLYRAQGVEVVHAHNQGSMCYGVLAALAGGPPVVGTRHGTSYTGPGFRHRPKYRALSWLMGHLCRFTACVGQKSLAVARDIDHVPASRLRLVYNGIDPDRYRPDQAARETARAELGLAPATPLILGVGRLSPEKAFGDLARALALAPAPGPPPVLALAGEGPEQATIAAAAREAGAADRVRLLGNRGDVPRLLAAADIFSLSSLSEGISLAILEAMAAGLPVAATAAGGNHEIVLEGETGFLTPVGDPAALAASLGRLLADPALRRALGAAGRQRVVARFSLAAMCQAYLELYAEALGR